MTSLSPHISSPSRVGLDAKNVHLGEDQLRLLVNDDIKQLRYKESSDRA